MVTQIADFLFLHKVGGPKCLLLCNLLCGWFHYVKTKAGKDITKVALLDHEGW